MMSQVVVALCACLLAVPASAASVAVPRSHIASEAQRIASIPMRMYKKDCWQKRPVSLMQKDIIPGAGLGKITPFETVLKDGFFETDCVKDYMFNYGDKFGKNSASYKQERVSNTSIVLYKTVVPKEDQEPMTHAVCFAFCRTVPDMLFFGIANGRDCYCAPFYKQMAGANDMCDEVCEGQPTTMCGGKSKSSMFAMHTCATTERDLSDSSSKMEDVTTDMMALFKDIDAVATDMQTAGAALQSAFGNVGDPAASNLMQSAKVFAGELQHAGESATALETDMTALQTTATSMAGSDYSDFKKAKEAEQLTDKIEEMTTAGTEKVEELEDLKAEAAPEAVGNSSKTYYSVMYFVDKEFDEVPSTCDGDVSAKPLVGNVDTCATACDAQVGTCVGFSFFESKDVAAGGLCFLFSKVKTAKYYTGCSKAPTFLQVSAPAATGKTQCMVKFANYEGTTLKPDPSGKCKLCLKEAEKADRCYE